MSYKGGKYVVGRDANGKELIFLDKYLYQYDSHQNWLVKQKQNASDGEVTSWQERSISYANSPTEIAEDRKAILKQDKINIQ